MSDFFSDFWSYYIAAIALVGIVWCVWLLFPNARSPRPSTRAMTPAMSGTAICAS